MPPKKKDRDGESGRNGRLDHIQTDHDLFLHAFEKPTQIYRYLRTRNMISPIFLHRNLTYLKDRCTRSNKGRGQFKIDSLLGTKLNKSRNENIPWLGDYMTLMFLGFFDKTISDMDVVEVETILTKISQKKRKDSLKALQERLGTSVVKINPDDTTCPSKVPAISVSKENFKPIGGSLSRSYILQLNVTVLPSYSSTENISEDEPNTKRLKTCSSISYESELVVFDKHSRCLLSDGEYELSLQERFPKPKSYSLKNQPSWELLPEASIDALDKAVSPFEDFQKCPTLKFRLVWTKEKTADLVDRPLPITIKKEDNLLSAANKENQPDQNHNNGNGPSQPSGQQQQQQVQPMENGQMTKDLVATGNGQKMQVVYQFIYNNNSLQQTETCDNFHCPWCTLNCHCLYSLLKHLKLCHARFNFTYVPIPKGARIDVTINEMYDGSYTGSPHDLVGPSSFAFSRTGPKRRPVVTCILVCRPKRTRPNLSEFLEIDENELNSQRPYITGHNRLYYHTMTCLPVHPKELDVDSEDEHDTAWLQQKTQMMIDEFTDVNEGEKELMKMWNLHTIKNGYVGDIQIPLACDMFVDLKGKEILEKNLYKNFVMHICNLCDYGLLTPDVQFKIIQKLQRLWAICETGRKVLIDANRHQLNYWNQFGLQRQQFQLQQQQLEQQQKKEQNQQHQQQPQESTDNCDDKDVKVSKKDKETKVKSDTKDDKPNGLVTSISSAATSKKTLSASTSSKGYIPPDEQTLNTRRKSLIQSKDKSGGSSNLSQSTENGTIKRKFSHLRDSPPRRRSSGTGLNTANGGVKSLSNRRNSLATIGHSGTQRKRLSLTLTKVDK